MIFEMVGLGVVSMVVGGLIGYEFGGKQNATLKSLLEKTRKELLIPSSVQTVEGESSSEVSIGAPEPNADGLSVGDKKVIMTTEEHLKILKKKHKEAYSVYSRGEGRIRIHQRASKRVMQNLIAVEEGRMSANITEYCIVFGNGDQVWIANPYFAYGHLYRSPQSPDLVFDSNSGFCLDPYVWLRVVDYQYTVSETDEWIPKTVRVKA